jgi:hypothetical protein
METVRSLKALLENRRVDPNPIEWFRGGHYVATLLSVYRFRCMESLI